MYVKKYIMIIFIISTKIISILWNLVAGCSNGPRNDHKEK